MLFLLAFQICLHRKFPHQASAAEGFLWEEETGDTISAIFHFVISSYYTVAQSMAWIKLSCHQNAFIHLTSSWK